MSDKRLTWCITNTHHYYVSLDISMCLLLTPLFTFSVPLVSSIRFTVPIQLIPGRPFNRTLHYSPIYVVSSKVKVGVCFLSLTICYSFSF